MAKVKDSAGESVVEDTLAHAKPWMVGEYGDKRDRLYVPGDGLYLSPHAIGDMERACRKSGVAHGEREYADRYHKAFISEGEIEAWYHLIQANKRLDEAKDRQEQERAKYEATCYEGTDTEDPTKNGCSYNDSRNCFRLDRSQSTVQLSITSGQRYLNGSSVQHHNWVHFEVRSPDGRKIVDVCMTFDQFAAFLVSNMATPCTVDTYWSITDECVRLQEVVKEPDTIHARMEQRLGDRLDDMHERLNAITDELDEQIAAGKAMSKTKLAEIRKALDVYKSHFGSNRDFTVLQAKEEVSSIVEQAAATIAWQHKLSPEELLANPHVQALMETLVKHKALPAPEKTG